MKEMKHTGHRKSSITIAVLSWIGAAVVYYAVFSFLFDTPAEYELRHSSDLLESEYSLLEGRLDSLERVVRNVEDRDRNIFAIMFESEPYDFSGEYDEKRLELHERLLCTPTRKLRKELVGRIDGFEKNLKQVKDSYSAITSHLIELGDKIDRIPSIQPVTNTHLSRLTASYGMLMHPFYRTLQSHQGVDYSVPEGTHVFATADGTVKTVTKSSSTSGITLVIDHGNGYATSYAHLLSAKVKENDRVRRGDIIALSGNTGLSLAPHLHYEVRKDGIRVDPIHYFFMELTPDEYEQIIRISLSGMQSLD